MLARCVGRPKDLQKRHAILNAAQELFLTLGYEGSSMDKIAKLAGVSKLTVYNHFQDKAQLFGAAIELACEQRLPKQLFDIQAHSDVSKVLNDLGCTFLATLYSPEALKLHVLMSSLVSTNVELVHLFYQAGPQRTYSNILQLFEKIQQLDKIHFDDLAAAADLFTSLLTDVHYDRSTWQVTPVPSILEIQKHVAQRVSLFLKLYPINNR